MTRIYTNKEGDFIPNHTFVQIRVIRGKTLFFIKFLYTISDAYIQFLQIRLRRK